MGLRNAELHRRTIRDLSDKGFAVLVREAVLSCMGARTPRIPYFSLLSPKVNEAVSTLLSLTQLVKKSNADFDAALQRTQAALKRLAAESLGDAEILLRGEDVTAALSYTTFLARFRALWVFLFGFTYPPSSLQVVPPHIFAVRWPEVLCDDTIGWICATREEAGRSFASIQSGTASHLTYFVFILQHTLSVRTVLLECVAEMMVNSAVRFDVMSVVRSMYRAYETLEEMADLQETWKQEGLFSDDFITKYTSSCASDAGVGGVFWDDCGLDLVLSPTKAHAKSTFLCPFLWILQHLVWCLYGRLTLLFQSCFIALPPEISPHQAVKDVGGTGVANNEEGPTVVQRNFPELNRSFGRRQESRGDLVDSSAIAAEKVSFLHRRTTTTTTSVYVEPMTTGSKLRLSFPSLTRGDSATRLVEDDSLQASRIEFHSPFDLNFNGAESNERGFLDKVGCHILAQLLWNITHERPRSTFFVVTDCTRRPGPRAWQRNHCTVTTWADDVSGRQGIEHWVLNFVCPNSRLSENPAKRAQQEIMLLRAVVFQVLGSTQRRARFTNDGSVFYVVRSDNEMDGGRLYFVLLLQRDTSTTHPSVGVRDITSKKAVELESCWAFRSLEEVCVAWCMPHLCNLAIRLAALISS
ncbi:hypothetical protein C3747_1g183 [Trypanosoma cruzi]|uniref:Uncharacterized protein n=1 Tax=Trypanosoma cruzi TaxID=5693 RepID=A0A2V2XQ19_TRYCR|nr:hypothetical protein C3747_1g183 [Trypanosoma cruzi]